MQFEGRRFDDVARLSRADVNGVRIRGHVRLLITVRLKPDITGTFPTRLTYFVHIAP
jgi:hypothetical protein